MNEQKISTSAFIPNVKRMNPLGNVMFLKVFGQQDSVKLTADLVNSVLEAKGIQPLDPNDMHIDADSSIIEGSIECKTPRADVKIITPSMFVDLESQRYKDNIADRMMCYAAKLLSSGLLEGMNYREAPRVVVIMLYDSGTVIENTKEYVHLFRFSADINQSSYVLGDKMQLVLIEVSKFKEQHPNLDEEVLSCKLNEWLYTLTQAYQDEVRWSDMSEAWPTFEEFAKKYNLALDDPKTKRTYEMWEMSEHDYLSEKDYARQEGLAEGLAKGEAKGREQGLAEGEAKGREQGLAEGEAKGRAESLNAAVCALMANLDVSVQEAFDMLNISIEDRETLSQETLSEQS